MMILDRISGQNLIAKVAVTPNKLDNSLESQGLKWMPSQGKDTHHGRIARAVGYLDWLWTGRKAAAAAAAGSCTTHGGTPCEGTSKGMGAYITMRPNPTRGTTSYIKIRK